MEYHGHIADRRWFLKRGAYGKSGVQRLHEAGADTIETLSRSSFGRSECERDKVKYNRKGKAASPGMLVPRMGCKS